MISIEFEIQHVQIDELPRTLLIHLTIFEHKLLLFFLYLIVTLLTKLYSLDRLEVKIEDHKRLEEIIGIYETNKFNGGVGIQASRFNHSCCSNAEGVWNKEDGSREFRIVKKVKSGETPCY